MKRLFCAVKVPYSDAIGEALESFRRGMAREDIRWVDPRNLHITLKFFGQTPDKAIAAISRALHQAAASCPPFSFVVSGCGSFGSIRQPRVIWLGINQADGLSLLYQEVNRQLEPLGYIPDKRIFSPHLTIGRVKNISPSHNLNQLEAEFLEEEFSHVEVGRFFLFESILHPRGPEYKMLEAFELGEGHRA